MKFIEKIGNIKVYVTKNANKDITITLMNGSDIITSEVYFTNDENSAIEKLLETLDIYTLPYIKNFDADLTKLSDNTYKSTILCSGSKADWFCRIDNTKYFMHYYKSENDFVVDKYGKKIIER